MPDLSLILYGSNSEATADGQPGHNGLGGRRSSDVLTCISALPVVMGGVEINQVAALCGPGLGTLSLFGSNELKWKAPGESDFGTPVAVGAGGTFELPGKDDDKWIQVTVTPALLTVPDEENVTLRANTNLLFPNMRMVDAVAGMVDYGAIFVKNEGVSTLKKLRLQFPSFGTSQLVDAYAARGSFASRISSVEGWPTSGFARNVASGEILYYASRESTRIIVPSYGRQQRDTQAASANAGDVIECIGPVDSAIEVPAAGPLGTTILNQRIAPDGISFFHPTAQLPAKGDTIHDLAAGDSLLIWLRRNVPVGAAGILRQIASLHFVWDS